MLLGTPVLHFKTRGLGFLARKALQKLYGQKRGMRMTRLIVTGLRREARKDIFSTTSLIFTIPLRQSDLQEYEIAEHVRGISKVYQKTTETTRATWTKGWFAGRGMMPSEQRAKRQPKLTPLPPLLRSPHSIRGAFAPGQALATSLQFPQTRTPHAASKRVQSIPIARQWNQDGTRRSASKIHQPHPQIY